MREKAWSDLFVGCGVLAGIAVIALGIMSVKFSGAPPTGLDTRIQRRVLNRAARRKHMIGLVMSTPGYPGFYFPATALLIALLRHRGARGTAPLVIASVGGWAIHRFIKLFAHRRRPESMIGRSNEFEAFPSGHTSATTAIAMTTAFVLARQHLAPLPVAVLIATAVPVMVGAGRLLADAHWATDVIGGWIGGIAIAALAVMVFERG
jgi:undecaprenyl-diphosphatase